MEYPTCIQSTKQKEFLLWLAQEKSQIFIRKFAIISNKFIILKIGLFRRVKELFKSDQTRYEVSHGYLECKVKKIFAIACLGKKFVFQSEILTYSLILFSKIQKFYRIKELFKVNQIDIQDYQYYLGCNAKRTVRLTFLVKKFVFHTEICD